MNQPPDKILLLEILDEGRTRQDYGDVVEFGIQLKEETLIQPIILKQRADGIFTMLAGSRRRAALISAGFTHVFHGRSCVPDEPGYLLSHEHTESKRKELELIENVRRLEMSWQERCVGIREAHELKAKEAALEGSSWTQRATAEMLGIKGVSNVNYALRVAELIVKKDEEIITCENLSEAWRKLMKREEDGFLDELATRSKISIGVPTAFADFAKHTIAEPIKDNINTKDAALVQYLSNPLNNPSEFDSYYAERIALSSKKEQHRNTIYLSQMLYCCDSIDLMNHLDCREKFDAIITDIPYGIDMAMLNQGNDSIGFNNIETVLAEHTVEGNEDLFKRFFPAAYNCLKPNTYLITWCDMWQFRAMADIAISTGFKVQRWPFVWLKSYPCMNQSANTNFTKTFEVALICRKGTPTLCKTNIPSHIVAGMDNMKDDMNHPFVKPFAVWEPLINAVTLEGQHILEPFVGHGSGLLSMLKMKRHVTACEINVEHFNSLIENTKQFYLQQNPNIQFA